MAVVGEIVGHDVRGRELEARVIPNGQLIGRVAVGGVNLDLHGVTASVVIRFGRVDPTDAPTASTINLTLLNLASMPAIACGQSLAVDLADTTPRFRGRITDLAQSWDGPDGGRLSLIAAGSLATLSREAIGYGDWPQELWAARIARIFSEANWTAYTIEAATPDVLVAARLASATTVGSELGVMAATQAAAIVDRPDGSILVQAMNARLGITTPVLVLPSELVLFAPDWTQTLDVINAFEATYGTLEDSHTVTSRNTDSVALYGERSGSADSNFALQADAASFGASMVVRRGYPHWLAPTVQLAGLLTPRIGGLVLLQDLPVPGSPLGDVWEPVCEGWTDTLEGDDWLTMLQLSDPIRSGLSLPWRNVPADVLWNTVNPGCTWADAYDLPHLIGGS